jgi:hypothetical protein
MVIMQSELIFYTEKLILVTQLMLLLVDDQQRQKDKFLDRSVNAYQFMEQIKFALQTKEYNWFLN